MQRVSVEPSRPEEGSLRRAVEVLQKGGIVAFPTETVYGLCVDPGNEQAVRRLYALKGRDAAKQCARLLPSADVAEELTGRPLPPIAARIAERLWPGPVTLVVPTATGETVGLRLPATALPRALAMAFGSPLLQTSANRSGEPAALNGSGVANGLGDGIELLLDGGRTPGGRSSTVVGCNDTRFGIMRDGAVSRDDIIRAATRLILLVCTGNICRSPMAEAQLRHDLAERLRCQPSQLVGYGFRLGSFGTMALQGRPASDHAVAVMNDAGLDLTRHRSRPFSIELVQRADLVYAAARNHLDFLRPYFEGRQGALQLLDPKERDIPDPYGRPVRLYRKVAEQVVRACAARAEELLARPQAGVD
ncbi:MAG: L-threonylcarbamoyladenylate synthase [Planctomycetota bacterium]|jgi:tRNA threonylcarbamoyl adenosine modification protein (Sua5/YciO/YrdC/YwlC family)